jgi:hypothetical protein
MNSKIYFIPRGILVVISLILLSLLCIRSGIPIVAGVGGLLAIFTAGLFTTIGMCYIEYILYGELPEDKFSLWLLKPMVILKQTNIKDNYKYPLLTNDEINKIEFDISHEKIDIPHVIKECMDSNDGICLSCYTIEENLTGDVHRLRCKCGGTIVRINYLKKFQHLD